MVKRNQNKINEQANENGTKDKKIIPKIVLTALKCIPIVLLYIFSDKTGIKIAGVLVSFYLIFWILSITYKKRWSLNLFNTTKGTLKFLSAVLIGLLFFLYLNSLVYRSKELYEYFTGEKKRGWEGIAHQADDTLGFKPVPNARAFHTFPIGDNIPMAFDKNGFRIPVSDTAKINYTNKTQLLFLGCSFTYGDACYAEETFPYLVAKETNLSYINAGVCGYGLCHMLILAERLIPEYKPDYVIVQYSQWLAERATDIYAPVYKGSLPVPYFSQKKEHFKIELPVYQGQFSKEDAKTIKLLYEGKFIQFLFKKGLYFYLYEDWASLKTNFLFLTGQRQRPATDQKAVEKYVYNKIKTIAEKNGAIVIILNIGNLNYSKNSHSLFSDSTVYFAEADSSLNQFLKTSASKDYDKEFMHWRFNGVDSIKVDVHPNFKAHRIIAETVISEINKIKNKKLLLIQREEQH